MPRLKRQATRYDGLQCLIYGSMNRDGVTMEQLDRYMGCTRQTVGIRLRDPDRLTLKDLRSISTALQIPFDELRQLIPGR